MFNVQVTRSRKGIVYARAVVAGPFDSEEEAETVRGQLAASDGNIRLGPSNPDSFWEVVESGVCEACHATEDRPKTDHTCAQ